MKKKSRITKKEWITIIITLLTVCLAVILYIRNMSGAVGSIENEIPSVKRGNAAFTDTFYSSQLTELEKKNYDMIVDRIKAQNGGVIEFSEPLTGNEYLRITAAINYETNFYYGLIDIPMNKQNVCVTYKSELADIKDSVIVKAIIFISSAEGINEQGKYDDSGLVTNFDEVTRTLSKSNNEAVKQVVERENQTDDILNQVVSGIPENADVKATVDYFLKWMDDNISYYEKLNSDAAAVSTMGDLLEKVYVYVNASAVTTGKASDLGYVKILSALCNKAGIESHIVMGAWGNSGQTAYGLCEIKIGDMEVYVDASGSKASNLSGQKYITKATAEKNLTFATYFTY